MIDRIKPIASSSAGNAVFVTDGQTPLLLDCGISLKRLRRELPCLPTQLKGALITHEHKDHSKGIQELLTNAVNVYATKGTIDAIGPVSDDHRLHVIRAKEQFQIGTWHILPFATIHDAAEPVGFLLRSGTMKVLYITDSAYIPCQVPELTHVLVETNHSTEIMEQRAAAGKLHEGHMQRVIRSHLSIEQVADWLQRADRSKLQEVHLLHLSDEHSDEKEFHKAIASVTGVPVYVAPR